MTAENKIPPTGVRGPVINLRLDSSSLDEAIKKARNLNLLLEIAEARQKRLADQLLSKERSG